MYGIENVIHKSSVLVNQRTFNTPNTDLLSWIPSCVSSGPSCLTWPLYPSLLPTTPCYILYLLQRSQSEGRSVQLRRWRGASWWNLASSRWRRVESVWEKRQKQNGPQNSSNSEPDWNQKDFFSSTTLALSLFALRLLLLSNPSCVDLVEPSFLMKTLDAEQKAQYLGRGGRDVLGRGLRSQFSHRQTGSGSRELF